MSELKIISQQRSFEGTQGFYSHRSSVCDCEMRFAVYQPAQCLEGAKVPLVTFLSGLTCTEENFTVKAGFQRAAAELGLMILAPDTSPRGVDLPGEDDSFDFGSAAGFYLDATQEPWSRHYQIYSYITKELPALVSEHFPADMSRQGIFGHSMGGHGALTLHLKNPDVYKSVSAFSPICAPMQCPWGEKAFSGYLGPDRETWKEYDSCELVRTQPSKATIFVDQGAADGFLAEQLKPELLKEACEESGQQLELRILPGYDHSYYFIATFIEEHLRMHARVLAPA